MKLIHSLLCTLLLVLVGCASAMGGRYNYNLEVRNIGKEDVWCLLVTSSKGMVHEPGILIPGAGKSIAPFKYPYADKWTVTWRTAKGEKITKTLDLRKAFPKPFKGHLVLIIDKDNNLSYLTEKFYGQ